MDLRYATANNFVGHAVYPKEAVCQLHAKAAKKLQRAAEVLSKRAPGLKLLAFDCLRTRTVQKEFWKQVVGTPRQPYVADPAQGSIHNFGFAIDLSLQNSEGQELDMGTPFDSFEPLAQPALEDKFLKEGKLTAKQIENRRLLRSVMTEAGFTQLPLEWWHYDAIPAAQVRKTQKIVE